jgi:hypothetical protein
MRRLARKGRGACLGSQCGEIGLGFARNGKPRARFRATCFLTFCPMVNCHVSIFRSPCRPDSAAAASATATAVQSSDRILGAARCHCQPPRSVHVRVRDLDFKIVSNSGNPNPIYASI